ncbi:hypothetical protein FOZ62_011975 [Perkinsus olseni]|uniref:Uncharacterized protein n=3 Tax=Perkinsus olseni TaxID=32597 RepID=A0A7J6SVC7_PEROL|nr:hypothetical protein FOZ62_011975 [Perkinsus olseni]
MRLRHPPFIFVKNIKRWQAKFRFWPPKDASPVQPIEPWGKQFFVYNARPNVELKGDPRRPDEDISRPKWMRDEIALSLLRPGENPNDYIMATHEKDLTPEEADENPEYQVETVLCITDFR